MTEFETFHRPGRRVARFPAKPKLPSADHCPDIEIHTASPPGYTAWTEWAERMAETHDQRQCPTCGYWAIWQLTDEGRAALPPVAADLDLHTNPEE